MYLYSLNGYEENIVLQSQLNLSKEAFEDICKQAPIGGKGTRNLYYNSTNIKEYLIETYNFKEISYAASFFVDKDFEEEIV